MEIFRVEVERIATSEGLEDCRNVTLENLRFRQEHKAGFILESEVFEGMKASGETFNIPSQNEKTCKICISRRVVIS